VDARHKVAGATAISSVRSYPHQRVKEQTRQMHRNLGEIFVPISIEALRYHIPSRRFNIMYLDPGSLSQDGSFLEAFIFLQIATSRIQSLAARQVYHEPHYIR